MSRTIRRRDPGLVAAIRRRDDEAAKGISNWSDTERRRYFRHDDAILRGQDGAIRMDKCQTATIDNEGGFKLNGHDYVYSKNTTREIRRKRRSAGKHEIRQNLLG